MLKARGTHNGRDTFLIGLSFGNLDRFRAKPLDTFIKIKAEEMDIPFDILIFSGRTEADLADLVAQGLGKDSKVHISPKLKS